MTVRSYTSEALGAAEPSLDVLCLADVAPRHIDWLWPNWLAVGKLSVLAGEGGQGKSTILCDWTSRVTTGERWPDNARGCEPGGVVILAAEDDVADTITPRMIAAGADRTKIFTVRSVREDQRRRSFNLQVDLTHLETVIQEKGDIRMVIIDPVSSYLGKVDSHKNAEVRSVLEPLGEMAARMRVAVVCNNHFSKGGGNANSRIIGSVAFVNQARAAFIVTPDAEDETRFLLMPSKMNIAPIKYGLAYRIEGCHIDTDIFTSRIIWELTPVTKTADQALEAHDVAGTKTGKEEAIEFLRGTLTSGSVPVSEATKEARAAGISSKSLRSAREALGVKPEKSGFTDGWVWRLPEVTKMPSTPEDAHVGNRAPSASEGTFGSNGKAPALGPPGDSLDDME